MDSGSQNSFIRTGSIRDSRKEIVDSTVLDISTFDTRKCKTNRYNIVDCTLWGTYGNAPKTKYRFIEKEFLANLAEYVPTDIAEQLIKQGKKLADNRNTYKTNKKEWDILIGCDQLWEIGKHNTQPGQGAAAAWETNFGWVVCGAGKQGSGKTSVMNVSVKEKVPIEKEESSILRNIHDLWTLDQIGITENEPMDEQFVENFEQTIERDADGRYIVKLPFKKGKKNFDACLPNATSRLNGLLKELDSKPAIRELYHEVFQEYIKQVF